ncbi:MAG: GNAT family N-acetyltransferase [Thermoplasmata archaeon]
MVSSELKRTEIIELAYDSPDLEPFYDLYRSIFSVPEESETLENIRKYLRYKTTDFYGKNNYHVLIAKESKIIGFLIGDYYANSSFGIIEFLGVHREFRGRGVSNLLLEKFEVLVEEDAKKCGNDLKGFMIEVEDPLKTSDRNNSLPFWNSHGYRLVSIDYVQPSLSEGKPPARNLLLLVRNLCGDSYIETKTLLSLLEDYFRYAMGKDNPRGTDEFTRIEKEASSSQYLNLRKVGSVLFGGVSVHYFLTLDLGMLSEDSNVLQEKLLEMLSSRKDELNAIKYGLSVGSRDQEPREVAPPLFARYLQNEINFSNSYLRRRFITRFAQNAWEENVTVCFEAVPGRKYDAVMTTLYSYNSMGTLTVEIVLRFAGLVFPELLMEIVERSNVRISDRSVESVTKEKLVEVLKLMNEEGMARELDPSRHIYPLIISTFHEGNLDAQTLYGILSGDTSYDAVSKQEVDRSLGSSLEREDLSIVDSISVYYQFNAAFVASRGEDFIFNDVEEITGYTVPELISKWEKYGKGSDAKEIVMYNVEAEYATEIELLRNQFSILLGIIDRYTDKMISYRLLQEQRKLLAEEEKIERRMIEINLIDVEHFTSLKTALQAAQRQMGILELKERATQLRTTLYRETGTLFELSQARKSNILNLLVAILIVSSSLVAVADSLQRSFLSIYIEIVSIVAALLLLVLYLIPVGANSGDKADRK